MKLLSTLFAFLALTSFAIANEEAKEHHEKSEKVSKDGKHKEVHEEHSVKKED